MTTLRDALSAAIDKAEDGTLQPPTETTIETDQAPAQEQPAQTAEQRARDEQGRFSARAQQANPTTADPNQSTAARRPPSSWKKDYWTHWEELGKSPNLAPLQDYIEKRESDFANGVSAYKSQWDQAQPLMKAIEPFIPELQQAGISPDRWIANLGNAHRMLSVGNPEQKAQIFVKLASDYGVNLQALMGGQVDPQFGHLAQTVNMLQNRLQQFEGNAQQQEQRALQSQIDQFAASAPHFEAVKSTMGQLLGSGMATDLQTAYDKAIRLHDDVWQQEQTQQASSANRQADIARKRAAASSPRSASPTGAMTGGGGKKSLRDHLSEAVEQVAGGRY